MKSKKYNSVEEYIAACQKHLMSRNQQPPKPKQKRKLRSEPKLIPARKPVREPEQISIYEKTSEVLRGNTTRSVYKQKFIEKWSIETDNPDQFKAPTKQDWLVFEATCIWHIGGLQKKEYLSQIGIKLSKKFPHINPAIIKEWILRICAKREDISTEVIRYCNADYVDTFVFNRRPGMHPCKPIPYKIKVPKYFNELGAPEKDDWWDGTLHGDSCTTIGCSYTGRNATCTLSKLQGEFHSSVFS